MPEVPEGSIIITPDQMYRETKKEFGHISSALDDLKTMVSPLPSTVAEHDHYLNTLRSAGLPERFTALEQDVSVLKGKWMYLAGAAFAGSLIIGLFGAEIASRIFG